MNNSVACTADSSSKVSQTFRIYPPQSANMKTLFTAVALLAAVGTSTNITYTPFDLFKNNQFVPCSINTRNVADPSTTKFVVSKWVCSQEEFCSYMAGTPIVLPTISSQTAFFPWHPTYLMQIGVVFSYLGLFLTLRSLEKQFHQQETRRVPRIFWLQLPLDVARIIAFLFKAIHGFANPKRFAWINVLLWLLPFTYVFVIHILGTKNEHTEEVESRPVESKGIPSETVSEMLSSPKQTPTSWRITHFVFFSLAFIMWAFAFSSTVEHWQFKWVRAGNLNRQTYLQIASAIQDPSTIGNMPLNCLNYLKSNALAKSGFWEMNQDRESHALIITFQFVVSMLVLGALFVGRREAFARARRLIICSALITVVGLLVPAIVTGAISHGHKAILRFTNDLSLTGGCTFAFLNMDRSSGYWDVGYEQAFRVVMSVLAAA